MNELNGKKQIDFYNISFIQVFILYNTVVNE